MSVSQSAAARCPIGARVVARYGAPLARGGWSRADIGEMVARHRGWVLIRVHGTNHPYRLADLADLSPYPDSA